MAIYRLLQNRAFEPERVQAMAAAYEDALVQLGLKDRNDPITEMVAQKIFEYAQRGEQDPGRLRELAVADLKGPAG